MAAKEDELGALHVKVTQALNLALDGTRIVVEEEGKEPEVTVFPPSAAIIMAAAKFLKDNEITCAPSENNALGALKDKVAERAAIRAKRASDAAEKRQATQDMSFMEGLPN